jgi:hypothetical protein
LILGTKAKPTLDLFHSQSLKICQNLFLIFFFFIPLRAFNQNAVPENYLAAAF